MEMLLGVFSAFGLSASAGLNAYIPLLVVGVIAHYFPNTLALNTPWDLIANPWILILLGILVIIEMLADKVPAVNHINDLIQTVVRPAAGAIAFAASAKVVTDINPILALACGLLVAGSGQHCRGCSGIHHLRGRDHHSTGNGNHTSRHFFTSTFVVVASYRQDTNCLI